LKEIRGGFGGLLFCKGAVEKPCYDWKVATFVICGENYGILVFGGHDTWGFQSKECRCYKGVIVNYEEQLCEGVWMESETTLVVFLDIRTD